MAQRVLVTGGCGFLGSHACEFFRRQGWEVIAFDNMTKHELSRTGFAVESVRTFVWDYLGKLGVTCVKADIRDFTILADHLSGCDYLIHTAAQPAMTISWEDPRLDMTSNVVGTFNVLEAARRHAIPVVSCATIHVYGNKINDSLKEGERRYIRTPEAIDEEQRTLEGSLTPLHASKAAADIYTRVYIDTYGLQAASFRLSGIYGARQFGGEDHGWVAHFSIRTVLDVPITIYGTGKQVRDIIYATDVCEAFWAFYKTRQAGIYNIGGGSATAISLLECIDIIASICDKQPSVQFRPARHGDLSYFVCDISKARACLGWEPKIMPSQGVAMLIEWIRENINLFRREK